MSQISARVPLSLRLLVLLFLLLDLHIHSGSASETAGPVEELEQKPLTSNGTQTANTSDHRVILRPGIWKIRASGSGDEYVAYQFFLGFNWTELKFDYPDCSHVACRGLPESQGACERICSTGAWSEASLAFASARAEFERATASLYAVLNDLAAIMDTHIPNAEQDRPGRLDNLLMYSGKTSSGEPLLHLDIMKPYRTLIENALDNIVRDFPHKHRRSAGGHAQTLLFTFNNTDFSELMDSWKSTAFRLSVQLNAVTFAFHTAHRVLLSCAQGVLRSDMTGCAPGFGAEFYTDTPVTSRLRSSSRLTMIVKREHWTPVSLSRWYMPFLDSSKGNRICWLDRPMVSDARSNYSADYKEPKCDRRGLCETLEHDQTTVSECQVDADGELGPECPVICGANCFGPICYKPETDSYTARTGTEQRDTDALRVTRSPRTVSRAVSLSYFDLHGSLTGMRNLSARSSDLLREGETLLLNFKVLHGEVRKYAQVMRSNKAFHKAKLNQCENDIWNCQIMATVSLVFSAISGCLFAVAVLKKRF